MSMEQHIEVSVIIVNYNTLHVIKPCIDSIVRQTKEVGYEIIVVDNGSTDGSAETLANDERITFIPLHENMGFGKANNQGIRHAKGKYIFFLNADTLLLNDAIGLFHDFSEHFQGKLGAVGCILEDRQGQRIHSYGHFPRMKDAIEKLVWTPLLKALHLHRESPTRWPEEWMSVDYVTGADLFVSRQVLDECGAFHPAFFMYFEETEMEHRFKTKGYENVIVKGPRIIHLEGEGCKDGSSKFLHDTVRQQRSEYLYFQLTEPRWKYLLYRIIHPILRQTVWLNPSITLSEKWTLVKQLFVRIKTKDDEYTR